MKRKSEQEEFEEEEKQRIWSHGEHWLRGEMVGEGSSGSAEVSDSESIRHEAEVLLDIKGCPFIIERFGEEITTSEEGGDHMVYNLLLEFASGGTLGDLIEKSNGHGLPEAEVRRYTRSILEGIKHIHKFDYVHCDLKPENILLVPSHATSTGSFVAKISDFGLAKKTKENCGQWRGTPTYLSPEALNDSEQEPPSDIWSLGCIVLEMLTGKSSSDLKPGCELEDFHCMFDHVCTPKIPAEVSCVARDFLKSCLAMRSCERLTAEKLLLHPFVVRPKPSKEARHTKGKGGLLIFRLRRWLQTKCRLSRKLCHCLQNSATTRF
ncbi:hypothetical protein L3X38_016931 [Prunus dulcis]|uniref:Protein kinase domain-containing protein n=1 Tax=Prunus dulcis TaxID=3755 RepID=A0AAD4Z9B0_PRUDU|nr:hypothetical protein L3X38_016931 [Prunus dulcis]